MKCLLRGVPHKIDWGYCYIVIGVIYMTYHDHSINMQSNMLTDHLNLFFHT